jgi:uncharacterized protein YdeI (YjbR/CyaY-like superfamily)
MMKLKDGRSLPVDIANVLNKRRRLLNVFVRMRPSCQKTYIYPVVHANDIHSRRSRIATMLGKILKYGLRHKLLHA